MAHARTALRNAVAAALAAAGTVAGSRVYTESRTEHFAPSDAPLIRLIVVSEAQNRSSMGGGRANSYIERTATVMVTYVCAQPTGYIDATDDALALIEIAMANLTGAGIKDITPNGVAFAIDSSGDTPVFSAEQTFEIFYITTQGNPAVTQ